MDQPLNNLGGLSAEAFLAHHWQKQPLLIRHAFPDFRDPLTSDELTALACKPGVASRIVLKKDGAYPREVRRGPFDQKTFASLPDTHWTLLVEHSNYHVPEIALLLDRFSFVPGWRVDEVMVSYAPRSGSLGPIMDKHDAFLLQGSGIQRWQVDCRAANGRTHVPDRELSVLERFDPDEEWVLEPGDMLYLPPRVPYHGVALEDCLSYSIGLRAPSHVELMSRFFEHAISGIPPDRLFADPDLAVQDHPGQIAPGALQKVTDIIQDATQYDEDIHRWFGRFITQGASRIKDVSPQSPGLSVDQFLDRYRRSGILYRSEHFRFAFIRGHEGGATLFIDGEAFDLDPRIAHVAPLICDRRRYPYAAIADELKKAVLPELLTEWTNCGYLYLPDD